MCPQMVPQIPKDIYTALPSSRSRSRLQELTDSLQASATSERCQFPTVENRYLHMVFSWFLPGWERDVGKYLLTFHQEKEERCSWSLFLTIFFKEISLMNL